MMSSSDVKVWDMTIGGVKPLPIYTWYKKQGERFAVCRGKDEDEMCILRISYSESSCSSSTQLLVTGNITSLNLLDNMTDSLMDAECWISEEDRESVSVWMVSVLEGWMKDVYPYINNTEVGDDEKE
jgi:hypothetical protein